MSTAPTPRPASYGLITDLVCVAAATLLCIVGKLDASYVLGLIGFVSGYNAAHRGRGSSNGMPPGALAGLAMLLSAALRTGRLGLALLALLAAGCTPQLMASAATVLPALLRGVADVAEQVCSDGDSLKSCARKCARALEQADESSKKEGN